MFWFIPFREFLNQRRPLDAATPEFVPSDDEDIKKRPAISETLKT
ncbi:MAG TPA: hypothetical protein VF538_04675 [Pyrinomonadaceae bacterium]|jgi:hypothetical protein